MTMPTKTAMLLDWALWYAERGIPVFPAHTPTQTGNIIACSCRRSCENVGKHPRTRHGLNDATLDPEWLTRWWTQWPEANIGLLMGVKCWALDVDPRKGGDDELYNLIWTHGELPDTPVSHTGGGGQHYLFAPVSGQMRTRVDIAPGIDVKGSGGYIIAPPSLHASGRQYVWDTVTDLENTPYAQAPGWLLDLCQNGNYVSPPAPDVPIPDGKRNETLSRMAFAMRRAGMALKEILAGLDAVNTLRCQPPLDQEELQLIVEGKRHVGPDPVLKPSLPHAEKKEWPVLIPATSILASQHRLPSWIIPGLLPEGLTIIGGLPKAAKSYLGYELVLACAGHGLGLGKFPVARGRAAYLAIEDDASDTKQRIQELRPGIVDIPDLSFLHGDEVPSISAGLVDYLRLIVTQQGLLLVVIDPLSYIYDPKIVKGQQDSFREAKDMLLPLRQLSRELHFGLVVIDHRRKQGQDDTDVFQTLYGSIAKYAVADVLIMVTRRGDNTTLHCRGRKIKDQTIECTFQFDGNRAFWAVQGLHDGQGTGALRDKLLAAFKEGERITTQRAFKIRALIDLAELDQSHATYDAVRMTLLRMAKAGDVLRAENGSFVLMGEDDSAGVVI